MDLTVTSLLSMVVYICCTWAIPAQSTSVSSKRVPKSYSDDHIVHSEMTAMDQIIEANEFQAAQVPDGTSFRDGDIAVTTGRRSKVCFARSCLWSKSVDGHVYIAYRLSLDYSDLDQRIIKSGMENMERGTCVRFVPWTHQRDYLDIQPKSGCWSYLGQRGGRQTLSLQSPDCMLSGVASHELMHALGFVHEHSRTDRDNYITVLWENIWKDRVRNFEKFKTNSLDIPYDYDSVMHFGMYSYSEDGDPTIIPKRKNTQLGQRTGLSELDKMKINILYKCDDMDRITIEMGMLDILSETCVKFVPRSHETNYLDIQPRFGCWSFLGMTEGPQPLSLQSPGCIESGIASHELMHALGFVHEQSRSDRDGHVSIIWENIMQGQKHNFKKYQTNNLNTVYDYGSIMHYGRYAFSEDGGPTIIPKPDPNTPIGQRDGPSLLDIHKINLLYECGGLV